MAVYTVVGDLLKSDCNIIAHQANCFGTMGAGIAKQIVRSFPQVLESDRNYKIPVGSRERLGHFSSCKVNNNGKALIIANLYGQYNYGRGKQTDSLAFKQSLQRLILAAKKSSKKLSFLPKIGIPYGIGCGLAGGNWNEIYSIINQLSNQYNYDIYLYKLS